MVRQMQWHVVPAWLVVIAGCSSSSTSQGQPTVQSTQPAGSLTAHPWFAVYAERNGEYDNDPVDGQAQIVFTSERVTITIDDDGKQHVMEGTYRTDADKTPKQIDMTITVQGKTETQHGVYQLENGVLHLYIAAPGKPRPTELASKPGTGAMYIRFRGDQQAARAEVEQFKAQRGKKDLSASRRAAIAKIHALTMAVKAHYIRYNEYPASLEMLANPPDGKPFVEREALIDPWGTPFHYDPMGPQHKGMAPDIWTEVPGKKPAEIIGNWMKETSPEQPK